MAETIGRFEVPKPLVSYSMFWLHNSDPHYINSLNQALELLQAKLSVVDENTPPYVVLDTIGGIGRVYSLRAHHSNSLDDAQEAIGHLRIYLESVPRNDAITRFPYLLPLGLSLCKLDPAFLGGQDLDYTIEALQEVFQYLPVGGHSIRTIVLDYLGSALSVRSVRLQQLSDIEDAIVVLRENISCIDRRENATVVLRENINISSPVFSQDHDFDRAAKGMMIHYRLLLSCVLLYRYNHLQDIKDLESAIIALRDAFFSIIPDFEHLASSILTYLDCWLCHFYADPSKMEHVNDPISHFQAALDEPTFRTDASKALCSLCLGMVHHICFKTTRNLQFLDASIVAFRDAARNAPPNTYFYHRAHYELAETIVDYSVADFDFRTDSWVETFEVPQVTEFPQAHEHIDDALRIASATQDSELSAKVDALKKYADITFKLKNMSATEEDIYQLPELVRIIYGDTTSGHLEWQIGYCKEFDKQAAQLDMTQGRSTYHALIDTFVAAMTDHTYTTKGSYPSDLFHISQIALNKARTSNDAEYAKAVVFAMERASKAAPHDHTLRSLYQSRHAEALVLCSRMIMSQQTDTDPDNELEKINFVYEITDDHGSNPFSRSQTYEMRHPHLLLRLHTERDKVLEEQEAAMSFFSRVAFLSPSLGDRFYNIDRLSSMREVAAGAVTIAIAAREYTRAFEWFDAGRSVVWGQLLQLRSPIDELRDEDPSLATERNIVGSTVLPGNTGFIHSMDLDSRLFNRSLADVHSHIKQLNMANMGTGRSNFFGVQSLSEIAPAARHGPVVTINIHCRSCDALALYQGGEVLHIPLPGLSLGRAEELQLNFTTLLKSQARSRASRPANLRRKSDDIFRRLWLLVVHPILTAMNEELCRILDVEGRLPHVTWCASGPLALLPLHAAGIYEPGRVGSLSASDFVVSSYTPSLSILARAHFRPKLSTDARSVLIVSQPNTPGQSPLPGTKGEAEAVQRHFPQSNQWLNGDEASVQSVLDGLQRHNIVHLACHGLQDGSESAFALHDGKLTLERLVAYVSMYAELAVLSACQTATGDATMPEEAVHLTSGMLVAGYRSVVGTMWSIGDSDAPLIMDAFYRELLKQVASSQRENWEIAYALHFAVKELREKLGDGQILRWAQFVHFGV